MGSKCTDTSQPEYMYSAVVDLPRMTVIGSPLRRRKERDLMSHQCPRNQTISSTLSLTTSTESLRAKHMDLLRRVKGGKYPFCIPACITVSQDHVNFSPSWHYLHRSVRRIPGQIASRDWRFRLPGRLLRARSRVC